MAEELAFASDFISTLIHIDNEAKSVQNRGETTPQPARTPAGDRVWTIQETQTLKTAIADSKEKVGSINPSYIREHYFPDRTVPSVQGKVRRYLALEDRSNSETPAAASVLMSLETLPPLVHSEPPSTPATAPTHALASTPETKPTSAKTENQEKGYGTDDETPGSGSKRGSRGLVHLPPPSQINFDKKQRSDTSPWTPEEIVLLKQQVSKVKGKTRKVLDWWKLKKYFPTHSHKAVELQVKSVIKTGEPMKGSVGKPEPEARPNPLAFDEFDLIEFLGRPPRRAAASAVKPRAYNSSARPKKRKTPSNSSESDSSSSSDSSDSSSDSESSSSESSSSSSSSQNSSSDGSDAFDVEVKKTNRVKKNETRRERIVRAYERRASLSAQKMARDGTAASGWTREATEKLRGELDVFARAGLKPDREYIARTSWPNRSSAAVKSKIQRMEQHKDQKPRRHWTDEEDQRLFEAITNSKGPIQWHTIDVSDTKGPISMRNRAYHLHLLKASDLPEREQILTTARRATKPQFQPVANNSPSPQEPHGHPSVKVATPVGESEMDVDAPATHEDGSNNEDEGDDTRERNAKKRPRDETRPSGGRRTRNSDRAREPFGTPGYLQTYGLQQALETFTWLTWLQREETRLAGKLRETNQPDQATKAEYDEVQRQLKHVGSGLFARFAVPPESVAEEDGAEPPASKVRKAD